MKAPRLLYTLPLALAALAACSDDDYVYPSLVTEFADIYTNADSSLTFIENDYGNVYVTRTALSGLDPRYFYRAVCGYEITDDYAENLPIVILYTLESVTLLRDSTAATAAADPIAVTSLWRAGNYINLHLTPKTQGGTHLWGYRTDSVTTNNSDLQTKHYLSLHHDQADDPLSYSDDVYASLYLPSTDISEGDSIIFTIQTFDGPQTWRFVY